MINSSLQGASFCINTQFCHGASNMAIVGGLHFGLTIVLPASAFDAKKTLEAIIQER